MASSSKTCQQFSRADLPRGIPQELVIVMKNGDEVRLVSVESLRDLGYTVIHARDGYQALELLEQHGGASLLFTDVVMPGMNGRVFAEQAILYPDLRALFTTGYTPNAIAHDGRLDKGVALITKPFTTTQLVAAKVRDTLDKGRH